MDIVGEQLWVRISSLTARNEESVVAAVRIQSAAAPPKQVLPLMVNLFDERIKKVKKIR